MKIYLVLFIRFPVAIEARFTEREYMLNSSHGHFLFGASCDWIEFNDNERSQVVFWTITNNIIIDRNNNNNEDDDGGGKKSCE